MKNFLTTFKNVWFSSGTAFVLFCLFIFASLFTLYFFTEHPANKLDQEEFRLVWSNLFPYISSFDYFSSWRFLTVISLNIISFLLIVKTIVTGKCSLLKGLKLKDILFINVLLYSLTLPFFCEFCFIYALLLFIFMSSFFLGAFLWNFTSSRFDKACNCEEAK